MRRPLGPLPVLVLAAAAVLLTGAPPPAAAAQAEPPPAVVLVLDASGSMNGDDGTGRPKLAAAKEALRGVIDGLPDDSVVGLRVYGHRVPNTDKANGCADTELVAPVAPLDRPALGAAIDGFSAKGFTPIGASLAAAAADLPTGTAQTVVLVSDGIDTCAPPDPCQVARDLAASGVGLRIETVGFQVDAAAADQLRCIAAATGGSYLDAPDAATLSRSLTRLAVRAFRFYETVGEPVQGTPEVAGAPRLRAETAYLDSIRDGQTRWYAIEVPEASRLDVTATLVGPPFPPSLQENADWEIRLFAPDGEPLDFNADFNAGYNADSIRVRTVVAGYRGPTDRGPPAGLWTVQLSLSDSHDAILGLDLPVELLVRVRRADGSVAYAAAPTPAEVAGPPVGVAAPGGGDGGGSGGRASSTVLALGALALVLAGAAVGATTVARVLR
ncbi:MAG: vWA domain-containing protein [Acidimicrobiales bacterium]